MKDLAPSSATTLSGFLSSLFLPDPLGRQRLSWGVRLGMTAIILALFGLSDLLILKFSDWPHLYGAIGVPVQRWEEVVIYTPFAQAFSLRNLFPTAPAFDKSLAAVAVFPWITFAIEGLLLKVVALGNVDAFLMVSHSVLPVVSFWLIYLLFKRYVSKTWALLLAFFGVAYFSGFHYLDGLAAQLGGGGSAAEGFNNALPEAARMPFPGISLILFLLPLYLTVRHFRLTAGRLFFLSFLWALQIYVYFFNFAAGAVFFTIWIIYARRMTDRAYRIGTIAGSIGIFLVVCALLGAPCYAAATSDLGRQLSEKLFAPAAGAVATSDWGATFGYGLPIALLVISFFLFQGDYYELFGRCMPVFLALMVDLLIGSCHLVAGGRIDPELYFHRISNIVFRFFYFIPFLYFISLPEKRTFAGKSGLRLLLHQKLPHLLRRWVHRYRVVYTVLGVSLLSLYIIANDVHVFRMHQRNVAAPMRLAMDQIEAVERAGVDAGGTVAYQNIAANLVCPAITDRVSLLCGAFGNFVDQDAILRRIVLYAKLMAWDEERLGRFLEPTERFAALNSYENKNLIITDEMMTDGLGYWLLNHKKRMSETELEQYRRNAISIYRNTTAAQLLVGIPVEALLVRGSAAEVPDGFVAQPLDGYTLIRRAGARAPGGE